MPGYKITTDIFTLPYNDGKTVLYAPLVGLACVANEDLINFLAEIDSLEEDAVDSGQKGILEFFVNRGLVNGTPYEMSAHSRNGEFSPSKLALFPTNGCNLNCRYCYASAEHFTSQTMDWDVAVSAIEYFIDLMKTEKRNVFPLEFHGGGEPFFAWNLVQHIVSYAEERCQEEGFELELYSATNGVLSDDKLNWLVEHFTSINVSFDGLPHVQDYHRAAGTDKGSFQHVDRTLRFFDEHNFPYGIRCAVSTYNEDLLEETIDFVTQNYKTRLLFLEPVYVCGSCVPDEENLKPDLYKFIENFKRLESTCTERGLRLEYSGAQFEKLTPTFCYVGTDDFAVTPDGYLTNCWEVTSNDHPLAETFIFGRLLPGGKISVDRKKLDYLRSLSVNNLEYCRDCFAKWHCAGDCVTRLGHNQYDGPRGGERCETNRKIIAHRIIQMMEREDFYQLVPGLQNP